jgi:hypothetical protein
MGHLMSSAALLLTSVSAAVRLRLSPPQGQGDHSYSPNLML